MAKTKMTRKAFISIGCHPDEDRGTGDGRNKFFETVFHGNGST
jgi:hypothetical protein